MASATPRLDGIDPEKTAELASRYIREGSESSRTDLQAAAFTQATAFATVALLAEMHRLRQEIAGIRVLLDGRTK